MNSLGCVCSSVGRSAGRSVSFRVRSFDPFLAGLLTGLAGWKSQSQILRVAWFTFSPKQVISNDSKKFDGPGLIERLIAVAALW